MLFSNLVSRLTNLNTGFRRQGRHAVLQTRAIAAAAVVCALSGRPAHPDAGAQIDQTGCQAVTRVTINTSASTNTSPPSSPATMTCTGRMLARSSSWLERLRRPRKPQATVRSERRNVLLNQQPHKDSHARMSTPLSRLRTGPAANRCGDCGAAVFVHLQASLSGLGQLRRSRECVVWRRRGYSPLKAFGAFPRVCSHFCPMAAYRLHDDVYEQQLRKAEPESPYG